MCGIFGMIGRRDHDGLREAALSLKHRGPDGFGEWASEDRTVYLAHCRLAIIDRSDAGRQPMANADGSIQLSFNGEIYNFKELRQRLLAAGHHFKSQTDSEVIVHGYAEWGDAVVTQLRGIFAFALWDAKRRRLLLARDRLGVKPLFYALRGGELAFASETRALLDIHAQVRRLNVDAMFQFLRHAYVGGAHTIWAGVARLPPATTMVFEADSGSASLQRYWAHGEVDPTWSETTANEALQELLAESVREQLVADVPIGVFLSGGIDSSLVAALAAQASPQIDSFFVDFVGWEGSERADAQTAAQYLGTRHHVRSIDRDDLGLADPLHAQALFSAFDEPLGDPAIVPTWHLARRIREQVTVALSGDGGDELFGGYRWYQQVEATPRRRLAWGLERRRRALGIGRDWPLGCASQNEYYHLLHCPSFTRGELAMLFPAWAGQAEALEAGFALLHAAPDRCLPQREWQVLDVQTYLVDNNLARVDRASMAHGLEVRVPILDHRIAELALSLPATLVSAHGGGKPLLRRLAQSRLPAPLHHKPKQGFSFPLSRLIAPSDLIATLRSGALLRQRMLDAAGLARWLEMAPKSNHEFKLWLLFVLEHWTRRWLLPHAGETA
jgi:asparagine synthase (glutamine-hydrolysing)